MEAKAVEMVYYPTGSELLVLVIVMLELLVAGYLLKSVMLEKYKMVPIKWAALMLITAAVVLAVQTSIIKDQSTPDRTLVVLFWCLAFALPPMWFFIRTLVDALSEQTTERIGTMGTKIDEMTEFNAARKLAQKGDVNGAIAMYRSYRENRSGALLEAARLLRTEERYAESVAMFQEISERYPSNKAIWAEATYNLAKIMENNLGQPLAAMQYLVQIKVQVPETKFAHMAESDLSRLQVMTGKKIADLSPIDGGNPNQGSDIAKIEFPVKYDRENMAKDLLDAPIPDRDPFMNRDIYTVRNVKPEVKTVPIHRAVVKKAAATKKKSVTAKKKSPATDTIAVANKPATAPKAPVKKKAVARKASASIGTASASGKPKAKPKAKTKASVAKPKAAVKKKSASPPKKAKD